MKRSQNTYRRKTIPRLKEWSFCRTKKNEEDTLGNRKEGEKEDMKRKKFLAVLLATAVSLSSLPANYAYASSGEIELESEETEPAGLEEAGEEMPEEDSYLTEDEMLEESEVPEEDADLTEEEEPAEPEVSLFSVQEETQSAADTADSTEQDWLHEVGFQDDVGGADATVQTYPLEETFDPAVHQYTLVMAEKDSSLYAKASSLMDGDVVTAEYKDSSNKAKSVDISTNYAANGKGTALSSLVTYKSLKGNSLTLKSEKGSGEYQIDIKRSANLFNLTASVGDYNYRIMSQGSYPDGTEAFFQKEYAFAYPASWKGQEMVLTLSSYDKVMNKSAWGYQLKANGQDVEDGGQYTVALNGEYQEVAIEVSCEEEGAVSTTYVLQLVPEEETQALFLSGTEGTQDSLKVSVKDAYENAVEPDGANPLLYTGLITGAVYSYEASVKGYHTVSGTFTAGESEEVTIAFTEKNMGEYLEDLIVCKGSQSTSPTYELKREEELDEEYGAAVYSVTLDSILTSSSIYFGAKMSPWAPAGSLMDLSAYNQSGIKVNKSVRDSSYMYPTSRVYLSNVVLGAANGYIPGVYTLTVGTEEDQEVYKILVYRNLQLQDLAVSAQSAGENLIKEKFSASSYEYTMEIPAQQESVFLLPAARFEVPVEIKVNGTTVAQAENAGEETEVPLTENSQDVISICLAKEASPYGAEYAGKTIASSGEYTITVTKKETASISFRTNPEEARVVLYDSAGKRIASQDDRNREYPELLAGNEYSYTVSCYGYQSEHKTFVAENGEKEIPVTLKESTAVHEGLTDNEWVNYRNNDENNGITDRTTPTSQEGANLKWGVKYGESWGAACTPPLILGGYLYTLQGNQILKLDKETGECVDRSEELNGSAGFALNPLTYGDGLIYAQIGNGSIQAVDAATLKSVWVSDPVGGQTLCPITYRNGYIYTGTWNSESAIGTYFCLSVTDEDPNSGTETKYPSWTFEHQGGFYWAGAYVEEGSDGNDYVVFGSDDGSSEGSYVNNAVLYSLSAETGQVVDKITGLSGDIRSSIAYDDGKVYFATKGGYLYRASLDNGQLDDLAEYNLGGMATATPLVYNGRVYVGVCGTSQFAENSGHKFAIVEDTEEGLELAYDAEIRGYPQAAALLSTAYTNVDYNGDGRPDERVYIYFTYNTKPGGIFYITDEPGQTESKQETLFTPPAEMQEYCISTLCTDKDGTLYYKNDSCYLMAVESNGAYVKGIEAKTDSGRINWNQEFESSVQNYEIQVGSSDETVDFSLDLPAGVTASVNGEAYEDGYSLSLDENGEGTLQIEVTLAGQTRTYEIQVYKEGGKAALQALAVEDAAGTSVALSPGFEENVLSYTTEIYQGNSSRMLIQAEAAEEGSTEFTVTEGAEIAEETADGCKVTFDENSSSAIVKIKVTSANGRRTREYQVNLLRKDIYPPQLTELAAQWTDADTAEVTFRSNETGTYYYKAVKAGEAAPSAEEVRQEKSKVLEVGDNKFTVSGLGGKATDIYVTAEDSLGTKMSQVEKVSLEGQQGEEEFRNIMPEVTAAADGSRVVVGWKAIDGAESYRIYRKEAGGSFKGLANVAGDVTSYVDETAEAGVTYYYTVKGFWEENAQGTCTRYPTNVTAKIPVDALATPQVKTRSVNYCTVEVTWNKVTGAEKYVIYRKEAKAGTSFKSIGTVSAGTLKYRDGSAKMGVNYYYTVKAYAGSIYSDYQKTVTGMAVPSSPALKGAVSSSKGVTVSWSGSKKSAGSYADGYRVFRKTVGGSWKTVGTVGANTRSFTDTTGAKGTTYVYTVRAYVKQSNGTNLWGTYDATGVSGSKK